MSDLDDAIQQVLDGDPAAFQRVVEATSDRLVRLGARMLGNVADAEDVVQEGYAKAYESLLSGRFERRAKVETWLYRIVVNGAIDAKRRLKRRRGETSSEVLADEALSADGAARMDARLALLELSAALGDLPGDQQAALVLKVVEGLSSAEIGEVLACTEGAVEQKLVRARAALRDIGEGGGTR